jgi:gliding motility-associated-like protein
MPKNYKKTYILKRLLYLFLAFSTLSCIPNALLARHIIGGEITYECLGYVDNDPTTNTRLYQFYMFIYRDCLGNGADFDSANFGSTVGTVTVYQGDNETPLFTFNLSAPDIVSVDPDPGNPCVIVPPNICVEEGVYTFPILELPVIDESYHIIYQRCCRNVTISNIIAPEDSGATYFMELTPQAQAVCNNSPTYNGFPPIVLCANESFTFDHSATDPDGDQLVYEFCTPILGGGPNVLEPAAFFGVAPNPDAPPSTFESVNFVVPNFDFEHPLGVDSDLNLNPSTGQLTGIPALGGQFVVGICVSEYRNGELLSTVRRDFQFNVNNCEVLVLADIAEDGIVNEAEFVINSCGENTIDMINESVQEANIQTYKWEFFMDGINPTTFTEWEPSITFPDFGQYFGRLVLNPGEQCSDTAIIRVNIFPEIMAGFDFEYDTCVAGPVSFIDESTSPIQGITNWTWDFGDGLGSSGETPDHLFREPGTYDVNLTVEDINGCTDEAELTVDYFPVPNLLIVAPNTFENCVPGTIQFANLSEPINSDYQIDWDFGDGNISEQISPSHTYETPGTFDVSLSITSPIGCETDTVFEELILITPAPEANFSFSPTELDIFNSTVNFTDQSSLADRWFWSFNGRGTSINPNPTFTFQDTGRQEILLVVENFNGCRDTIIQELDIKPVITYHLPNAFTPNNDSKNDEFRGVGYLNGIRSFEMGIWNRWGELIFNTSNPEDGWNGRKNNSGKRAPNGVYTYIVKFTGPRGRPYEFNGLITLIR